MLTRYTLAALAAFFMSAAWAGDKPELKALRGLVGGKEVFITNAPCAIPEYKKKYPNRAYVINRELGLSLDGCYGPGEGVAKDMVHIQWRKGDWSELPAEIFLVPDSREQLPVDPKSKLKAEGDPV